MATIEIAARDGIHHVPSNVPAVHRTLVVVDPPMEGRDVANLQRATHARLKARGLADDVPVAAHGKFTLATALACIEAQYFLGLRADTYLRKDAHGHRYITEGAQRIIRQPELRSAEQLERAQDRRGRLKLGPRYYEKLRQELVPAGRGIDAALAFAAAKVGIKESPAGSNDGPQIRRWCKAAGYADPVPWCGCFVNACLMAGGLPSGASFGIGSTVAILNRAKAGTGGWSFHGTGKPGDLALYDDSPFGAAAVHVEIVRERLSSATYSTYGGNTSSGDGSQSNGGMVARHDDRSTMGAFHIIGFARPPWDSLS
jgi:hypothetical protein